MTPSFKEMWARRGEALEMRLKAQTMEHGDDLQDASSSTEPFSLHGCNLELLCSLKSICESKVRHKSVLQAVSSLDLL